MTIKHNYINLPVKTNNELKVWFREKVNSSKQQYFSCNEKGIGRVYDSRIGSKYYKTDRCKFSAGYGWQIGKQRKCKSTAIEIIKVELNSDNDLSVIEFKWRYKSKNTINISMTTPTDMKLVMAQEMLGNSGCFPHFWIKNTLFSICL